MRCLIFFYIFFSFFYAQNVAEITKHDLDSLYQKKDYNLFFEEAYIFLKRNKSFRSNYEMLLKLANGAYQLKKYDLSESLYRIASSKDTLLSDYVTYFTTKIKLAKKDTLDFYKSVSKYLNRDKYKQLDLDLFRIAVNTANKANDTTYFLHFVDEYAKYRKLKPKTAYKRLQLLNQTLDDKTFFEEQINFLKEYTGSRYADLVVDTLYSEAEIDSLKKEELYWLLKASIRSKTKDDSLIQYYYHIDDIDHNELLLDYVLTKKEEEKAIELILETKKKKGGFLSVRMAQMLPRLQLKHQKKKEAYHNYLEFARLYPNHSFSLNAVTFVLGRLKDEKKISLYLKVLKEFTKRKSKYQQYYRFRNVLYFYELGNFSKALVLIKKYDKLAQKSFHKHRLLFWKAKILFELERRDEAFRFVQVLAKKPFEDYFTIKSYIALIENKKEETRPGFRKKRKLQLKDLSRSLSGFSRLNLIREVYGIKFFNMEFRDTEFTLNGSSDYQSYIHFLEKNDLYHKAFRTSVRYRVSIPPGKSGESSFSIYTYLFPMYYFPLVKESSEKYSIEEELIQAVIYQESAFQKDAVSNANAHGLMQLLPSTGKRLSERSDLQVRSIHDLYQPALNIKLGAKYLHLLLQMFQNKIEPALASYNAGESRVKVWVKKYPLSNADLFIERIPFEQTRTYVKKVLYAYYAYRILSGNTENIYYSGIKKRR